MREDVLQFIWQTQSFNKAQLITTNGDDVRILNQGVLNSDSGPDFSSARIKIDGIEWVGDVEIHTSSSAWKTHNHHLDSAYNKVILHVVWEHDKEVLRLDKSSIPTVTLSQLVSKEWLEKYNQLSTSLQTIPCEAFFPGIDPVYKLDAFNKALVERLQRKAEGVLEDLELHKGDWEQVAINLLFEYFGFKKNNEAFKHLASIIDIKILRKLSSVKQIEAYLLGMAGLLVGSTKGQSYQKELASEFEWLRTKYRLQSEPMTSAWWKFMRMRPANFPTIRMAQLAAVLNKQKHFFQSLLEVSPEDAKSFFKVRQSEFWLSHYHFNKEARTRIKGMGDQSARVLSINVAGVLLVAYGRYTGNDVFIDKAITFLEKLNAEDNKIIRIWNDLDIKPMNAAESQGAIELFNNYCNQRRCLSCNIGRQVLKPE